MPGFPVDGHIYLAYQGHLQVFLAVANVKLAMEAGLLISI